MSADLDVAHAAAAALTEDSTVAEVALAVELYRKAAWPDGRPLSPGTFAWFMADYLPRWLAAQA